MITRAKRYLIRIVEQGQAIYREEWTFDTKEEAVKVAERNVDDALPSNTVEVLEVIGHAYFGGDGGSYYQEAVR